MAQRGRKKTDPKIIDYAIQLQQSCRYSIRDIEKMSGISSATMYKFMKERGVKT